MAYNYYNSSGGPLAEPTNGDIAIDRAMALANNPLIAQDPALLQMFNEQSVESLETDGQAVASSLVSSYMNVRAENYRTLPAAQRHEAWVQMSEAQRTALIRDYGVTPPSLESDGGYLSAILTPVKAVAGVAGDVLGAPMSGLAAGAGKLLHALDVGADQGAHLFRTAHMMLEEAGIDLSNPIYAAAFVALTAGTGIGAIAALGGTAALGAFSTVGVGAAGAALGWGGTAVIAGAMKGNNAWDAWWETGDGERHFTNDSISMARELLGNDADLFLLAEEMAGGSTLEDIAADQFEEGTAEYASLMQELRIAIGTEEVQGAIAELNEGKVSPGRWLVDAFTPLDKSGVSYARLSGLVDAAYVIVSDPTLAVGRSLKAHRLSKVGLDTRWADAVVVDKLRKIIDPTLDGTRVLSKGPFGRAEQAYSNQVHKAWQKIADAFSAEDTVVAQTKLLREMPAFKTLHSTMKNYVDEGNTLRTVDEVLDFFETAVGTELLLKGKGMVRRGWGEAPALSRTGSAKAHASSWFREAVDFGATAGRQVDAADLKPWIEKGDMWYPDSGSPIAPDTSVDEIQRMLDDGEISLDVFNSHPTVSWLAQAYRTSTRGEWILGTGSDTLWETYSKNKLKALSQLPLLPVKKGLKVGAKFAQTLTRQVPFGGQVLDFAGPGGTAEFMAFVEMAGVLDGAPTALKNFWISQFTSSHAGMRRNAVTSVVATAMAKSGFNGPGMDEFRDQFVTHLTHGYSMKPITQVMIPGGRDGEKVMGSIVGILPTADASMKIRIPNFKELMAVSRKASLSHRIHYRLNPDQLEKAVTQVWKPSVILRLGFIPRAGGEELFNALMRHPGVLSTKFPRYAVDEIERTAMGDLTGRGLFPGFRIPVVARNKITRMMEATSKSLDEGVEGALEEAGDAFAKNASGVFKPVNPGTIEGPPRNFQDEFHWDDLGGNQVYDADYDWSIEHLGTVLKGAITNSVEEPVFASSTQPLLNSVAESLTNWTRDVLRNERFTGSKVASHLRLDLDSQRGTRALLTTENPQKFAKDFPGGLELNEKPGAIQWLTEGLNLEETNAYQALLDGAGSAAARAWYTAAMGSNMRGGELGREKGTHLGGSELPNSGDVSSLYSVDGPRIISLDDGTQVTYEAGDPLNQLVHYGAVQHWQKDKMGRQATKISFRYMNPKVRQELTENTLWGIGTAEESMGRLIDGLNTVDNEVRGMLQKFLANPLDGPTRTELLEVLDQALSTNGGLGYANFLGINPKHGVSGFGQRNPSQENLNLWVTAMGNLSADARGTVNGLLSYETMPKLFDNMADVQIEMRENFIRRMNDPDMAQERQYLDRSHMSSFTDAKVVNPLQPGHTSMYVPLIDRNELAYLSGRSVRQADGTWANSRELQLLIDGMVAKEWPPEVVRNLEILLSPGLPGNKARLSAEQLATKAKLENTKTVTDATNMFAGNAVPINGLAFPDPKDARKFAADVSEILSTARGKTELLDHRIGRVDLRIDRIGELNTTDWKMQARSYKKAENGTHAHRLSTDMYQDVLPITESGQLVREIDEATGIEHIREGITKDQALDEHATVFMQRFNEIFLSSVSADDLLPTLSGHTYAFDMAADNALNKTWFSPRHIGEAGEALSRAIRGPMFTFEEKRNMGTRFVNGAFDKVITPAIDAMVRQPLFTYEYLKAYKATNASRKALRDPVAMGHLRAWQGAQNRKRDISMLTRGEINQVRGFAKSVLGPGKLETKPWPRKIDEIDLLVMLRDDDTFAKLMKEAKYQTTKSSGTSHIDQQLPSQVHFSLRKIAKSADDHGVEVNVDLAISQFKEMMGDPKMRATGGTYKSYRKAMDGLREEGVKSQKLITERSVNYKESNYRVPSQLEDLSYEEFTVLNAVVQKDWAISHEMNVIATQRAFEAMIPFVDDSKLRSQFQMWVSNYIPFWFAQEQFLKRWGRTMIDSPEAIRRMQLVYGGLQQSGIVFTDPNRGSDGEMLFLMPGSAAATTAVAAVADKVFGYDSLLPISMPLTGKIMNTAPGINDPTRLGVPGAGPTITLPIQGLAMLLPEYASEKLMALNSTITGYDGEPQGILDQLYPPSVQRFTDALFYDADGSKAMAHSTRAIQYLSATGDAPADDASPSEVQKYLDKVQNLTRILMLTEAIYGTFSPASPQGGLITGGSGFGFDENVGFADGRDLTDVPTPRFFELMAGNEENGGLSFGEAIEQWLLETKESGIDVTPWTVFEGSGKRAFSRTEESLQWMEENETVLREHADAAMWLIPHKDTDKDDAGFSWKARNELVSHGLTNHKTLSEFYTGIKFAAAMPVWVERKKKYDLEIEKLELYEGPDKQAKLLAAADVWRREEKAFHAQHPLWSEQFASDEGDLQRKRTIAAWTLLADDINYVRSDHFNALNGVFELYQIYEAQADQLIGRQTNNVQAYKLQLSDNFRAAGELYVTHNPMAKEFWSSVIEREIR